MKKDSHLIKYISSELLKDSNNYDDDIVSKYARRCIFESDLLDIDTELNKLVEDIIPDGVVYKAYLSRKYDFIPEEGLSSMILFIRTLKEEELLFVCLLRGLNSKVKLNNVILGVRKGTIKEVILKSDSGVFKSQENEKLRQDVEEEIEKGMAVLEDKYDIKLREKLGHLIDAKYIGLFREGLARVQKDNGKWSFIDRSGRLLDVEFYEVGNFSEGLARVKKDNGKWSFIDRSRRLLDVEFYEVGEFSEGLARVWIDNGKYSFIDKSGRLLYGEFNSVDNFSEGLACVEKDNGKWSFIDRSGRLLDVEFDVFDYFFNRLAGIKKDNSRWNFIDRSERLLRVQKGNGKWSFIDRSGRLLDVEFDGVDNFSEGLARVWIDNGKWSFIDKNGKLLDIEFNYVNNFSEGLAGVQKDNGKWSFIDRSGSLLDVEFEEDEGYFAEGLARVLINGDNHYIDHNLRVIF